MTPELAYDAINHAIDHAIGPVSVMVGANMCDIDLSRIRPSTHLTIEWADDNEGVVPMMHRLWERSRDSPFAGTEDLLAFIHDDLQILERGWDERVKARFAATPECDVVGFVGGTGIGASDIYRSPYRMIQLGRHNVHSNMTNAEAHGRRTNTEMRLATADGCALVVRRSFLDRLTGWSWWHEVNHGYDNAVACMLRRYGREMWLVPVSMAHPSPLKLSGVHRNPEAAKRYDERFGGDTAVHARAHTRLYEEYRDVLPFQV